MCIRREKRGSLRAARCPADAGMRLNAPGRRVRENGIPGNTHLRIRIKTECIQVPVHHISTQRIPPREDGHAE